MIINRLLDLEKDPAARGYTAEEYDLDQFRIFLNSIGNPERGQKFIHIAGTKGKGSTAAICEGLLRGLNYPTALFSSPHLWHYGERFRFDGVHWKLAEFEERLERFYHRLSPEQRKGFEGPKAFRTVFEVLTALALTTFRERGSHLSGKPQFICWETGLGGRLDCTNVVDPVITVITSLAMDHTEILGDTIEKIAAEKAGIMKKGRPTIVARQAPEFADRVWPVLLEHATKIGAPIIRAWEHNAVIASEQREAGQWIRVRLPDGREVEGELPLAGEFQHGNFEAALAAVWYALKAEGVDPMKVDLLAGLPLIDWPGRLEVLRKGAKTLVLDGAHCAYSARNLAESLAKIPGSADEFGFLFSMLKDKEIAGFLKSFRENLGPVHAAHVYTYRIPGPRGADPYDLAAAARAAGFTATDFDSSNAAFRAAIAKHDHIVASGTLYTLGHFKQLWRDLPDA
ncbi:folylpolyglutamate synthase/dihydrofolate synthase family protein [soil metagenome]